MKNIPMDPVFLEHDLFCSGAVTAMWRFFWLFPLFLSAFFNQLQQNPGDLLLCDLLRSAVCVSLDSEKKAAAGACSVGAEMMTCDVMHMWCCEADDKMRKDTPRKREKDYSHWSSEILEKYLIKKTGVLLIIMPMAVSRGQLLSEFGLNLTLKES